MKISDLFEVDDASNLLKAVSVLIEYWRANTITPELTQATQYLINNLPSCVYKGEMIRGMEITTKEQLRSTVQLTSLMHSYALEHDREIFGWSQKLNPSELYKSLVKFAGSNVSKQAMFYVQQEGKGIDCAKLADYAVNALDLPTDQWKSLKRNLYVIHEEREILAPFYNNVHLIGVSFEDQFFGVDRLDDGFRLINNRRNKS